MFDYRAAISGLPARPGVYLFYDEDDRLLYIGKSVNIRSRVRTYFGPDGGHTHRTARLKSEAARIEALVCGSELEALLVESRLIKARIPLYNIMGRTYRHYPFIKIPAEPFPRVHLTYDLVDDGGTYFGPFPGEIRARDALEAMRPLFKWRSCTSLPDRACLEQAIGRCAAPCVGAVDATRYAAAMAELHGFLGGAAASILNRLEADMRAAAEELQFERARVLRDRLAMLAPWVTRQNAFQAAIADLDAVIVLPAVEPDASLWLVVRRGRLVHTESHVTRRRARGIGKRMLAALEGPPPSLTVQQAELDEINIISAWLHKHRAGGRAVSLAGLTPTHALEAAWQTTTRLAEPSGRAVAERAAERVIAGPDSN